MQRDNHIRSISIDTSEQEDIILSMMEGGEPWREYGSKIVYLDPSIAYSTELFINHPDGVMGGTSYKLMPLALMLEEHSEDEVRDILKGYKSSSAISFSPRLREDAIDCERTGKYRTFLLMGSSDRIHGYFMLGLGGINIKESNAFPPYFLKEVGICGRNGTIPAFVLAQISRSVDSGSHTYHIMMKLAHGYLTTAKGAIGRNIVMLCCDDEQVRHFEWRGFRTIHREDECINHMLAII